MAATKKIKNPRVALCVMVLVVRLIPFALIFSRLPFLVHLSMSHGLTYHLSYLLIILLSLASLVPGPKTIEIFVKNGRLFFYQCVVAVLQVPFYIGLFTWMVRVSNNWWDSWPALVIFLPLFVFTLWIKPKTDYAMVYQNT
ncbi:hypothetical protein SEVIR_9G573850v4 [Setaria viridis]